MKVFQNSIFFYIIILLQLSTMVFAQKQQAFDLPTLFKTGELQPVNREIKLVSNDTEPYIQLLENKNEGIVWLPIAEFKNGTLEIEMRGKDVFQRSFIGIAFHGLNDSVYDAVYCRPFNFFAKDSVRKIHAIQYISHPVFTWEKLRRDSNAIFEKQLMYPPDPNGWFTMKLVIEGAVVKAFVNGEEMPSLIVEKLTTRTSGKIGLFTGDSSGGDFKKITIAQ